MISATTRHFLPTVPRARDILTLLKPITWFPPMWALLCGVVSSGVPIPSRWPFLIAGIALGGPLVCGTSQAVNDWFDRFVDAINEPDRPIPSGRVGGRWGLWIALFGTALAALVAFLTGPWVFGATLLGLASAWAYSAPPFRLKQSGVWGPIVVAANYEGLTWFTGASVMLGTLPPPLTLMLIALYSAGAIGIMTLNDFKAVAGDRATGIRSLPATIGIGPAARIACLVMALPQFGVILLLAQAGHGAVAWIVAGLLAGQLVLMVRLLRDPRRHAPWYNATGTTLYVVGMMATACGIGGVAGL